MKKILLFIIGVFSLQSFASSIDELLINNPYDASFRKAYNLNPSLPKGVLESVAFSQSRFTQLGSNLQEPSCIGYPTAFGVMGLTENGQGYFRNNLVLVSQLSGYSVSDIKTDVEKNILAYAKAFSMLQQQNSIYGDDLKTYLPVFIALSELPLVNDLQNDFAMNAHLYQLYWFLSKGDFQDFYGFPDYQIDMQGIFGSNYEVLSSSSIVISPSTVTNSSGASYKSSGVTNAVTSPDYAPALWNPTTCNYSSRSGAAITMVAIHDVEGSYAGCISWFKNCSASASAHYVVRSSDGQITQMVYEIDKAWHIGSENPYTLGIEHEGYASSGASWYTTAMLTSSAALVRDMCSSHSISPLRCYFGPGCSGTTQQCQQGTCVKIKGHQMFPNQTHSDPGPYWNWDKFYKLLNNTPVTTTITATGGTFYDTGGSAAAYSNDERKLWLFKPAGGATSVSMNFTTFNVEKNYDYMFIYDGSTVNAPLIGKYTSTVSPGNINSTGANLLVEFRSDCGTTASGWAATYTTNAVPSSTTSVDNIAPTTMVSTTGAWKTATFTSTFTDADNAGGSGLGKSFYQVIDFNGTEWRGNYTRGFFSDNFDSAIHPDWTQGAGTWGIANNALEQSLQTTTTASNTSIYATLTQTLSNRYLYNFKGKIDGTGTNRRAGFHFFIDNPTLPNRGNSYFVYFRLDAPKVQIYKTVNDVFYLKADSANVAIVANQWYDYKVIFDRTTGKIDVYKDNTLVATWTDNTPLVAGDVSPLANGSYISFRSGDCKWSLDEIKVYRSRPTASVTVPVGAGNANDARYQNPNPTQYACKVKSIVNDIAGNLSSIDYEDVNIDWTNPSNIATIKDGKSSDINNVITSDSLSANWSSSKDPNSAIAKYWYSIGTSPGAVNTLTWTSNWGDTTVTAKNLTLVNGTTYYFNVKSENGAGLFSNVISTNGQTVTISVPTAPTASINAVNTVCAGQTVALSDASSGGPTNWLWNMTGASPATANTQNISITYSNSGVYTVTLTASNTTGTNTATKTITVSPNPTVSVSASNASICAGANSTLSVSGASSYIWSPATNLNTSTGNAVIANPATSITYTVIGTTGSCTSNNFYSLTVTPNPTVTVSASNASICTGQSTTLTATGAGSYSWSPVANLSASSGSMVVANPTVNTVYSATGTSGSCSSSNTFSLTVGICTGINILNSENYISINPNPFSDIIQVSFNLNSDSQIEFMLYDVLGKEILHRVFKENAGMYTKVLPMTDLNLSSGVYWLKVKYNEQDYYKKMIKN